jgi:hypothetical protein
VGINLPAMLYIADNSIGTGRKIMNSFSTNNPIPKQVV